MDRTACVDLTAFPLQLLLKKHPDWRAHPAAVVADDRPQGEIFWVNRAARSAGILPGMRYAAGLSLAGGLRAAVVTDEEVREGITAVAETLRRFTPHVESAASGDGEPGVFWLDARGLERLFGSLETWALDAHRAVTGLGFHAALVVGFSRFGAYALARAYRGVHVVKNREEERTAARAVKLERLSVPPAARDGLERLGVRTVGDLVDLPADGAGLRYGPEVRRIHRLATGALDEPLRPEHPDPPAVRRIVLDHPVFASAQVRALIDDALPSLLDEVGRKGRALTGLDVVFRFERLGDHVEAIRTAAPTLDAKPVAELVRLRLETLRGMPDVVMEVIVVAVETEAATRQRQLFADKRRDLEAANRALARVRALVGDDRVVRARPAPGHLPEAAFAWERIVTLYPAKPGLGGEARLIRRLHRHPVPLPPRPRHEPDGWLLRGLEQGPVVRVLGPYVVSGGWWGVPVHREYHFAETKDGGLLWVFYDRGARRWFLQGRVE